MKKYHWSTHKIVKESVDTITIYFNTNQQKFSFFPGQYLNIKCTINGEKICRSYSFSSTPSDEFPSITVKRVTGGKMSNYLVDYAASISLWDIEAPFGNFMLQSQIAAHFQIVLLAGGSGISPLYSMLKSIKRNANIPLLLYGNKSPQEAIFWSELEVMQAAGHLISYNSFTSKEFRSSINNHIEGRFTPLIISSIIKTHIALLEDAHYYICGPIGLMELYQKALFGLNIPTEQIHTEYFEPLEVSNPVIENDGVSKDVIVNYFQDHYVDDAVQTYECTTLIEVKSRQSLLDALKEHNINVPSSCKNGTCGTCWAVKTDGEVRMVNNHALTGEDMFEGVILLCQSYPTTLDVAISLP